MYVFLTHGLQLVQQIVSAPPHTVMAVGHGAQQRTAFPRILQGRHVQVVDQHDVWVLSHVQRYGSLIGSYFSLILCS